MTPIKNKATALGLTLKTVPADGTGRAYIFERSGALVGAETGARNASVWLSGYAAGIARTPEEDPRVWIRTSGERICRAFDSSALASEWLEETDATAAIVICRGRRGVARVESPRARAFRWRAAVESALSLPAGTHIRQPTVNGARVGVVDSSEPSGRLRVRWEPPMDWLDSWAWPSEIIEQDDPETP